MTDDLPKFGMRIKANRPGFAFGAEKVIQHSFQEDILPEVVEQHPVKEVIINGNNIEKQVFNQPTLRGDTFMMPFQVMSDRERVQREAQQYFETTKKDVDTKVPESELEKRRKSIIGKIW